MGNRFLAAGLASLALMSAAPAAAQGQPAPEAQVDIAAIPGVVSGDAQWTKFWEGPMIVDGMTADADGNVLFAQEQSNSIIKVWPDGKWWVQWPFVHGAGAVSIDAQGRTFAADRSCTDPGLGWGANCTVLPRIVQLTPERKVIADKFADGSTLGRINDLAFDTGGKQLGIIPTPRRAITATFAGPDRKTLYIGTLGANTPTGENWTTPQGVRNIAATIYGVNTLATGSAKRAK